MKKEIIKKENEEEGRGLMQMFQAGFFDGYTYGGRVPEGELNNAKAFKKNFKIIMDKCRKAFELRYADKLQGKIKIGGHLN